MGLWFGAIVTFMAAYGLATLAAGWWHWARRRGQDRKIRPFVSLLLLVRDQEDVVEGVVRELLGIAYLSRPGLTNYELVAVDDGSSDGSGEILERLARGCQRIKVVRLDRPRGSAESAAQVGLFLCRSRVVILLDLRGPFPPEEVVHAAHYLLGEPREPKGSYQLAT